MVIFKNKIETSSLREPIQVIIALKGEDPQFPSRGRTKGERRGFFIEELKRISRESQKEILSTLEEMGARRIRSLWIINRNQKAEGRLNRGTRKIVFSNRRIFY